MFKMIVSLMSSPKPRSLLHRREPTAWRPSDMMDGRVAADPHRRWIKLGSSKLFLMSYSAKVSFPFLWALPRRRRLRAEERIKKPDR